MHVHTRAKSIRKETAADERHQRNPGNKTDGTRNCLTREAKANRPPSQKPGDAENRNID